MTKSNRFLFWAFSLLIVIVLFNLSPLYLYNKNIYHGQSLKQFEVLLNEHVSELMDYYQIPGANIALVKNGQLIWVKAFGYADIENKKPMTVKSYCRVESISKPVVAWGIMRLVQEGKLNLDTPVINYIKDWSFPKSNYSANRITTKMLLSHTSGLPLGTIGVRYSPKDTNIPELKTRLSDDAVLIKEPGKSFTYSNTGFNILELLIEDVSGLDFNRYMTDSVLIPLGMINASFEWNEMWNPEVPKGYDLNGKSIPVYIYPDKASGGLFATPIDIATFVCAGMPLFSDNDNKVLNSSQINKLYQPVVKIPGVYGFAFDFYGLGFFIEQLPDGKIAVSHGGQGSGWMTHFCSIPETGSAIVLFTNSQRSWPFIANIINDWTKWNGFSSMGMSKILFFQKMMWIFIILILILSIRTIIRFLSSYKLLKNQFIQKFKSIKHKQILQIGISFVPVFMVMWAFQQKYFFLFSVFPVLSIWLAYALSLLSLALFVKAFFSFLADK